MCLNTNGNNIKLKLDKLGIISRDNKKKSIGAQIWNSIFHFDNHHWTDRVMEDKITGTTENGSPYQPHSSTSGNDASSILFVRHINYGMFRFTICFFYANFSFNLKKHNVSLQHNIDQSMITLDHDTMEPKLSIQHFKRNFL